MTTISASGTIYLRDTGSIEYSTDNTTWTGIGAWPVTVVNTNIASTLIVLFTTNITLTANNQYFICGSDNIQFGSTSLNIDGTRPTIFINGANTYPGLIQNGNGSNNGKDDVSVYNLIVDGLGAILADDGGWIGQTFFSDTATSNKIINCSSLGNINTNGGGILGSFVGYNGGSITIISCGNSSGSIGSSAGGIVGSSLANNSGSVYISQCFSTNTFSGSGAGGIVGGFANAATGGLVVISNCYSTSIVSGSNSGGIFGSNANNCTAQNCYSLGNIIGFNSGGIFGGNANNCTAINCYGTGIIGGANSGGIFGNNYTISSTAYNCYTTGKVFLTPPIGGIYSLSTNDNIQGSNNYSEAANGNSGNWNDNNAAAILQSIGWTPGNIWGSLSLNTPYVLLGFGASPYTLDNIDPTTKTLVQTFSQSIQAGDSTPAALAANYKTFAIQAGGDPTITIANSPSPAGGVITTTSSTPDGTYTLYIYAVDDYTTTTYNLTVNAAPTPPTPAGGAGAGAETTIPPCCQANICNKNPQESSYSGEIIANKRAGNTINTSVANFYNGVAEGGRTVRSQPIFKSYYQYMIYLQGKTR